MRRKSTDCLPNVWRSMRRGARNHDSSRSVSCGYQGSEHAPPSIYGDRLIRNQLFQLSKINEGIDFVVETAEFPFAEFMRLLGPGFDLDPQVYFETITGTTRRVIRKRGSPFNVEIFLLSGDEHDRERFARREDALIDGLPAFVPTPEDILVAKLRWYSRGRRPKDWGDIVNLLAARMDRLDWQYLRSWCEKHQTARLLDEAIKTVQESPKPNQT
jgi:hypothetical protein